MAEVVIMVVAAIISLYCYINKLFLLPLSFLFMAGAQFLFIPAITISVFVFVYDYGSACWIKTMQTPLFTYFKVVPLIRTLKSQ